MKSFRTILALGILALSSPVFAGQFQFHAAPPSCKGPIADFFYDLGFKAATAYVKIMGCPTVPFSANM